MSQRNRPPARRPSRIDRDYERADSYEESDFDYRRRTLGQRDPYEEDYYARDPYRDRTRSSYQNYEPPERPPGGCSLSWMDLLFLGLLGLAAARGGDSDGCAPGRGCRRVVFFALSGLGLLFAAGYLTATEQSLFSDQATGVMACVGSFLCIASFGSLLIVATGIVRILNLDLDPDDAMNQAGGLLGGLFGR